MRSKSAFILKFMLLLCSVAMAARQIALAGENKALKADLENQLSGKPVVSKIVFGGQATPRGYDLAEYPVNTLVYPGGGVTYRVEWGLATRMEVSTQEMRRSFDEGTSFHVRRIDLKDDWLELKLESGSGDSAKLKLMLGTGWQSKYDSASLQAQLARVFVLDQQPEPTPERTVASTPAPEVPIASPSATSVYRRDPNAPKIEGRIPEDVFRVILTAFDEEDRKAFSTLFQDAAVLSRSLLTYQKAYRWNSDGASRPQLQVISQLQDRLGKNLQPQSDGDVIVMNEVFKRCVRVSQLGQARDEQGRLYGAGRDDEAFQRLFLSDSAVDLTRKVQQDVETERAQRAIIDRAKAAAISVEQSLDRGDLIEAHRQYGQMLSDAQLAPVQQYLQQTAAFRQDLESYVAATQLHGHLGTSLPELVSDIGREQESLQASESKPLTKAFLERTLPTDKAELKRRLDSLPAIKINKASYEIPAKFEATTAANAQEKSEFLKGMLDDLDSKLAGVSEMKAVVTQPQVMGAIGQELGEASLATLKLRQEAILEAERIRAELVGDLTAVQAQIERYQAQKEQREAEARARIAAEKAAQERRRSEQRAAVGKEGELEGKPEGPALPACHQSAEGLSMEAGIRIIQTCEMQAETAALQAPADATLEYPAANYPDHSGKFYSVKNDMTAWIRHFQEVPQLRGCSDGLGGLTPACQELEDNIKKLIWWEAQVSLISNYNMHESGVGFKAEKEYLDMCIFNVGEFQKYISANLKRLP